MDAVTAADLGKRYAAMSGEELSRIKREDLSELAQGCYDREIEYRKSPEYGQLQLDAAAATREKEIGETKRCFFCGAQPVAPESAAQVQMYSNYQSSSSRSGRTTTFHKTLDRSCRPRCEVRDLPETALGRG